MTKELLIDAVGYLDESYLADFHQMDVALVNQKNVRKRKSFRAILISAAAIMLVLAMLTVSLPVAYIANYQKVNAYVSEAVDRALFPLDSEDEDVKAEDLAINWVEWKITEQMFQALGAGTEDSVIDAMKNSQGGLAGEMLADLGEFLERLYKYYLDHKQEFDSAIGEIESELDSELIIPPIDTENPTDPPIAETVFYFESLTLMDLGEGFLTVTNVDVNSIINNRVKVPSEHEGYKVRAIDDYAFANQEQLKSVILPDTIDFIGAHAFENCSSMTNFSYQEGVDVIGDYAFAGCVSLEKFTVYSSIDSVGVGCFAGCTSLVEVNYNCKGIVPDYAFDGCTSLRSVIFYESVQSVGAYAFNNCESFLNLAGRWSLSYVGPYAFYNSGLGHMLFYGETISAHSFENCKYMTSPEIENSVTEIEDYAFYGCGNITYVSAVFDTAADWESVELGRHVFPDGTRIVFIDGSEVVYYDSGE